MACTRIESREEGGARRRLVRKRHFLTSIAAGMQSRGRHPVSSVHVPPLPSLFSLPVVLLYEDYRALCNYVRVFYSLSPVRRWPRAYTVGPTAFASPLNAVNLSERAATRRIPRHWPGATWFVVLLFTGQSTRSSLSAIRYDRQRSRSHEEGGSGIKLLILFSRGCYARDMLKILSMVEATGGFLF